MTLTYDHQVNSVNREFKVVAKNLNYLIKWGYKLPWIIALFVILIFGLLFTLVAYLPIRSMRKSVTKLASLLQNEGPGNLSQREAMEKHAEIEELRNRLESTFKSGSGFFVIKPIITEMGRSACQFKIVEDVLFKHAYPQYGKPLTTEEENQLKDLYRGWKEDWTDEKMNVYND